MFQYAKMEIEKQINKSLNKQREIETEMNEIKEKKKLIERHETVKHSIKFRKKALIRIVIVCTSIVIVGVVGLAIVTQLSVIKTIILSTFLELLSVLVFGTPIVVELCKAKKQHKEISQEEYEKLKSEEEKNLQLEMSLEKDYAEIEAKVTELEDTLAWIEKTESMHYQTEPFFQADNSQQYEYLTKKKKYWEQLLGQYLEEKINYSEVHLQDCENEIDKIHIKCLIKNNNI